MGSRPWIQDVQHHRDYGTGAQQRGSDHGPSILGMGHRQRIIAASLGLARLLEVLTKCSDAVFDAEAYPNNSRWGLSTARQ